MIRILHTADVHLGREFPSLREKGPHYRKHLLATFERIVDLAVDQRVSLFLIAGDLFDSNAILGAPVRTVTALLTRLAGEGIRTCILPGTHDKHGEDSIYRFMSLPRDVTVLTPDRIYKTYPDLDLTVYGRAYDGKLDGASALEGLSLRTETKLHVGMAHCSLRMDGLTERDTMMVDRNEISASGFDYLALGHWHSFRDCSQGSTKAFYSGSPEPIDMNQKGAGSVALVTIHDRGKVDVQQIRVGSKLFEELIVNTELLKSLSDVTHIISSRADPNLILEVTLEGTPSLDRELDPHELEEELRERFHHLRVVDRTSERLDDVPMDLYPPETLTGAFVRAMETKMARCRPEDKGIYADALRLGFALIQNGPQVIE